MANINNSLRIGRYILFLKTVIGNLIINSWWINNEKQI
tara:strand:+ start:335 stop:448 length:114 start_codon:yes stop_codon:yes gene_type:complete